MDIKTRGGGGGVATSQWALEDGATRLDNDSVYLHGRATDRMSDSRLSGEQLTVCLSACLQAVSPFFFIYIYPQRDPDSDLPAPDNTRIRQISAPIEERQSDTK